jgi:hypothetical protein
VRFKLFCFCTIAKPFVTFIQPHEKGNFGILSESVADSWLVLEARLDSFVGLQSGNENVKYP